MAETVELLLVTMQVAVVEEQGLRAKKEHPQLVA